MFDGSPGSKVAGTVFGDEGMDVRVPFEIPAKGMKDTDKAGSKAFGFIHIIEHTKDNIPDRRKEKIQKRAVIEEVSAKFLWDGKHTMPVNAGNKFAGHVERTYLVVFVAAGRAETALAAERDKFEVATMGTPVHGTTERRVTTVNHLVDIFHDGRTGMELVLNMFVIISENGL